MTSRFSEDVQEIIGPILSERGFTLDEIDDHPDEGGRERHVAYYRSDDSKIQIYQSSRDGEVNAMIAPVSVPNEFGPQAKKWQYFGRFAKRRDVPLEELVQLARAEYDTYANPLEWVRDRIIENYLSAHSGILQMYAP